ncbi:MAG: hypothetical protein WD512_18355 [Candidatus Paceibacterota bacterium]
MENNETKKYTDIIYNKVGKLEKETSELEYSKNYDLIFNSLLLLKEYLLFFKEHLLDDSMYDLNDRRYLMYSSFLNIQGDLIEAVSNLEKEEGKKDLTDLMVENGNMLSKMAMMSSIPDDEVYNRYRYLEHIDPNEADLAKVQGR